MKFLSIALALCIALGVNAQENKPDSAGFKFTDVIVIPGTSVKNQNKSGTCWCFSSNSFFENEILKKTGKEVDLSEMYVVRLCYGDKAENFVRNYGSANFSQGGSGLDVPYVWARYGMVPESAYPGLSYGEDNHVHGEVEAGMKGYLNAIVKKPNRRLSTAWRKGFEGIADAYFGELPETFEYEGKTYTPRSFADQFGLDMNDYVAVTSFTHHPFYESFVMEVPDNWLHGQYLNVPLDDFQAIVDNALDNGYSVAWAADVSEKGFQWAKGVALMPAEKAESDLEGTELSRWVALTPAQKEAERFKFNGPTKEVEVTQAMRQEMFDRQETTDDHGMVIVGKAFDQNGNPYYKVKNSWADNNHIYHGYFYVSVPYFKAKTMDIYVNKAALPKEIASKAGITTKKK